MLILLGKSPAVEQLGCEVGECLAVADTVNSDGINLCAVLLTFLGVFFFFLMTLRSLLCIRLWIGVEDEESISKIES